jgi:cellulose 1,4-beta-cellobiosidase
VAVSVSKEIGSISPNWRCRDTLSKTTLLSSTLSDIRAANKAGGNYAGQFVVYDLPDRDCAADNGVANYKNYIDTIVGILKTYSDIRTILVIGNTFFP